MNPEHHSISEVAADGASMPARRAQFLCAAALLLGASISGVTGFALARQNQATSADVPEALGAAVLAAGPGGGLHGPSTALAGSSIVVTVGSSDTTVECVDPSTGEITAIPVGADRRVTIPVPAHAGELIVRVGSGKRCRVLLVEIVMPSP